MTEAGPVALKMRVRLLPALVVGAAITCHAHQDLSITLDRLERDIRKDSMDAGKRLTRAWLLVDHGEPERADEDIRHLLASSDHRTQGLELQARRLFHVGNMDEARAVVVDWIGIGGETMVNFRLLARIELARGDTAAAIAAGLRAWDLRGDQSDFLFLFGLWKRQGRLPVEAYRKAQREFPAHAAVADALFDACLDGMAPESCHELSSRALTWWPASVDWRLKHARALLMAKRPAEARETLADALELLDSAPRDRPRAGFTREMRREIFALYGRLR